MNSLPYTLSEYEADPSFQALSTDEKNTFYQNYDAERSSQATSEDDIASIHEERIARKKSAFQTNYKAAYPEDTAIDSSKLEGPLREMYEGFQSDYGEQQHNATVKPESYRADDIETAGSALSYKPYKFNGTSGYSVSYPDGSYELVPNIADKAQLTEFLQKQRADRFTGKREGWLDKLVGDNELTGIVNKMRNEESGLMGGVGEARKGWEGVKQGFTTQGIVEGDAYNKAKAVTDSGQLDALNAIIKEQDKFEDGTPEYMALEKKRKDLQDQFDQADRESPTGGDDVNLSDKYKNLFDSMKAAQGIKGSSVMGDFQRYVQSLPKEQRGNNLKDFFWNNPGDILPYIGAVAASSAPDTVAGIGSAAIGTMAGGPIGGATASGSYGMAREYSASLLQSIKERSNEENAPLTPDLIEAYMNDTAFMDKIKSKAGTRAGVIGAADAVFGGVVGKIMDGVKGAFKKTALTTGLDAVTEAGGEAAAQVATGEWNTDEVLNEGFGALGTAAATAPYAMYKEGQQEAAEAAKAVAKPVDPTIPPTPEQKAEKPNDIKAQTDAAKAALQARVNQAVGTAKASNGQTLPIPAGFSKDTSFQKDLNAVNTTIKGETAPAQLTEELGPKVSEKEAPKGQGRLLFDSSSTARYEEVTTEEAATMGGGTIIGLSDNGNPIVRRNAPLGEATQLTDKPVSTTTPAEDSLLKRSVIARWIDKKYRAANPEVATDPTRENNKQAAEVFKRNPMAGHMFDVLSTGMPTDLLEDALHSYRSNEHQDQQGALMSVFGITDNDSSRRILTNALGNYWEAVDPDKQDADEKTQEAYNLAHRLNNVYKYLANVENIYELNEANVGSIDKGDMLFNLTPDSNIDPGSDTQNHTAQGYFYVDGPESIRRLDTALKQASVVRAPVLDNKLNDKFIEASALQRPGVLVTRLADLGADPHEAAKRMNELYPDGWVIKDATGHAGKSSLAQRQSGRLFDGQYYSFDQPQTSHGGLIKGFQSYPEHYQNWYVESLAQLPKDKMPDPKHQEHRVHLYVDKSGKAHVFRNLTFDKSNLTPENFYMLGTMSQPANPNSPVVKALQAYAQRAFTGRTEFNDMIFGVDISMQQDGKDTPFVFEANAMTVGMSGWLGNPFAMSELMSVMTGRPSFMTGMYELAKTQLTAEELSVVRAEVNAGMPSEYFSNPEYYRALEQGVALWNKYIPIDSWYAAMQKMFDSIPMKFLRELAAQIQAVFHKVVDPIFEKLARQGGVRESPREMIRDKQFVIDGKVGVDHFNPKHVAVIATYYYPHQEDAIEAIEERIADLEDKGQSQWSKYDYADIELNKKAIKHIKDGTVPKFTVIKDDDYFPRGAYRVDGVQKGFGGPTGDDWVPMYQNVTIIDSTHPFDGSTLTIPLNGKTQLTEEEIQSAVDMKRDQPTGIDPSVKRNKTGIERKTDTFLLPDKNTNNLSTYIDKILHHPALPNDYKAILEYIKEKFSREQLSAISVQAINNSNFYNTNKDKLVVGRYNNSITITMHEIIHAVTSNYVARGLYNLAAYYKFNSSDNNQTLLGYVKALQPSERDSLIKSGIPADFLDLVANYMAFLNSVGVTTQSILDGENRVGGDKDNYKQYDQGFKLPYAALNLDEFLAESLTRRQLQRQLAKMPSIVTKAKSMLHEVFTLITRVLGMPFNKQSFLLDVVLNFQNILSSPDNTPAVKQSDTNVYEIRPDEWYYQTEGNKQAIFDVPDKTAEETNTYSVNGIQFKKGEVSNPEDMTRRMTEPQREILENEAKEEIRATRFAKMKAENPEILSTSVYDANDPNSFVQAREAVTDKLAAAVDKEDADGKVETVDEAKKREQVELLERNKFVAARSLVDMIDKPGITLSVSNIMVAGFEYIMNQTVDPDSLSLNKLKYFNNAIESLADEGEAPVGMKHVIGKAFHEKYLNELAYLKDQEGLDFNRPLPDWFRKPFLGIGQGNNSSLIQHATEVAWIGMNEDGVTYLQNLMGTYKQNIELKEIEEETLNQEFYDHIDKAFPKNSFRTVNAHRIGIVARLTQYDRNDPTDPLGQINKRVSQLTESLKLMNEHNANKHDITKHALESLGPIDPRSFPDAAAFIADLESRLVPREKSTLDKIRDMGARYHPALKAIKAITRKAVLEDWANYVHDASVTPTPESEVINISNLDSITTVLADRKGINPFTTYPELDIRAVMQTQNKAIAYEKHTGVERSVLASALHKSSALSRAIDGSKPGVRPVSDRLRELLVSYHNGMTGSQAQTNGLWSTIEAYVGALAGSLIVGANAFAKNFISSSLSRAALTSIGAGHHMFVYDANKGKIDKFLKDNVPTQARRVGHYDNMPGRQDRWKLSSQVKAMSDAKVGFMKMFMRVAPQIPEAIARSYSDNVLSVLSNLSNARPEKYNASAIWTGAYIKYLQDAGLVTGASDFLVKLPINQAAIFKANEFTSRALGYAPDKASKGSFWNGSSRDKQVLSKLFYMFSQQKVGLTTEFQSNMLNAGVNFASGDLKEGSKYTAIAMANLMNGMAFRYASIGLSSYMYWSGLHQYFDAGDDEERRKAMAEAQRKYTQASAMSNIRDGVTETAMNFLPIANSALVFENAVKMGLDMKNIVLSPVKDNFATFQVHMKEDLQAEVKSIDAEIQQLNQDLKFAEKLGSDTIQIAQAIDKLEVQKAQLTEQIKFKYFPSQGYKAAFSILGAYGIAMEDSYKMMDAFTGEDVEDEDKVAMENMMKNEFVYKDNLAGSFYGSEMLMGASNFARAFFPSEWVKKDYEKVPTDVFWKSRLKVFQNPAVVLERGRRDMAKQALQERKEAAREAAAFEARMIGGKK